MTENTESTGYRVTVRSRGGSGNGAMWQWEVHAPGKSVPVQKGVWTGTEVKAYETANAAAERFAKRAATKAASDKAAAAKS